MKVSSNTEFPWCLLVRAKNAFSVNQFKEYLVHKMHKQIRRDFSSQKHGHKFNLREKTKMGKAFSHLLTFIIIQNGFLCTKYSPACSTFSVAAQLLSGHLLASFAA
jgi:hypothetical protein